MSYSTSSTLLDYYGSSASAGATGGSSSRYDYIFGTGLTGTSTNSYSSYGSSTGPSAIDRYYSYLDDLTSGSGSSSKSASSAISNYRSSSYLNGGDIYSMPRYSSRYSSDSLSTLSSSGYGGSYRSSASNYASEYSSRYSRPMISRAPTYDKYGKELSNYDRWRMSHGETVDTLNNNSGSSSSSSSSSYNNNLSSVLDTSSSSSSGSASSSSATKSSSSRRRISRIEDDSTSMGSGGSILTTSRELSVMPGATTSAFENDLSGLPSRFANMGRDSGSSMSTRQQTRGKSLAPTSSAASSSSGYASSFGGKSYGSSAATSSRSSHKIVHSFPLSVSSKLAGYEVRDVKGDGGCYYRCLSVYFTGTEDNYNKHRREVVGYIRDHMDNYSSMIRSEVGYASTNDYFSRKMRTDHQEFAETTEIIATCCLYNINIHVLALVPGKRTWEWLHFDPSIGSGRPSNATRDIYLYNQGSVHFMLCTPK